MVVWVKYQLTWCHPINHFTKLQFKSVSLHSQCWACHQVFTCHQPAHIEHHQHSVCSMWAFTLFQGCRHAQINCGSLRACVIRCTVCRAMWGKILKVGRVYLQQSHEHEAAYCMWIRTQRTCVVLGYRGDTDWTSLMFSVCVNTHHVNRNNISSLRFRWCVFWPATGGLCISSVLSVFSAALSELKIDTPWDRAHIIQVTVWGYVCVSNSRENDLLSYFLPESH